MRRRDFLAGMIAVGAPSTLPNRAHAYSKCMPHSQYGKTCESGIQLYKIREAYNSQHLNQWCWAASVQMAFEHYGYRVTQPRIVQETYGVVENIPAVTGYAITKNLQRKWIDDKGNPFNVQVDGLYDFNAGIIAITDREIVKALEDERPLILGTTNHAVLLISVGYVPTPMSPTIYNIGVADPWPGVGVRGPQSPADLIPMHRGGNLRYLCLPRIS